ncbi:hypothetical protein ACHAWU_009477 [Discostella pseudostelligera]|uniref:Uncharacterized protein n=1 Tax=Discostella pseudostelligera TaxID=259834 RepID=A0ABD3M1S4_9STRA
MLRDMRDGEQKINNTYPLVGFAMLIIFSFFVDGIADIVVNIGIVSCTDVVVVGSHRHCFV